MEKTTNDCKNIQEDYDNMDSVEVVTLDNQMDMFNVSLEDLTYAGNHKI